MCQTATRWFFTLERIWSVLISLTSTIIPIPAYTLTCKIKINVINKSRKQSSAGKYKADRGLSRMEGVPSCQGKGTHVTGKWKRSHLRACRNCSATSVMICGLLCPKRRALCVLLLVQFIWCILFCLIYLDTMGRIAHKQVPIPRMLSSIVHNVSIKLKETVYQNKCYSKAEWNIRYIYHINVCREKRGRKHVKCLDHVNDQSVLL